MKQEDINRCQIQEWYPKFKGFSIKTVIIELPESFLDYLAGHYLRTAVRRIAVSNENSLPDRIRRLEDETAQPSPPPSFNFPELEMKVNESIQLLGGAVFPKLNWSSPKDSTRMSRTQALKCTSFSDIVRLLKSSHMIVRLCSAYNNSFPDKTMSRPPHSYLALRQWLPSLRPEMEFRCFVRAQKLVGVSQRKVSAYYPALREKKDDLKALIHDFFLDNVEGRFESENYTFDVYVTDDRGVKLIDFGPWSSITMTKLFTWKELKQDGRLGEDFDFRIVESQPTKKKPGLKTAAAHPSGRAWVLENDILLMSQELLQHLDFHVTGERIIIARR